MRQKKVWRYWCDHCNKGGCGKAAMLRHEQHCIRNPERSCRMCVHNDGGAPEPMAELIEALNGDGLDKLREVARGCPACMLAAIVQNRGDWRAHSDDGCWPDGPGDGFDYKAECVRFWADVNDARREEWPCVIY